MRKTFVSVVLATAAAACSSSSGPGSDGTSPAPAPSSDPVTDTPADPTSSPAPSNPDAPTSSAALGAVTFRNTGRYGSTLSLTIKGSDPKKQTSAAIVRLLDAQGNAVAKAFDTDWDGVGDAPERRFHFDTSTVGKAEFTGTITIPRAYATGSSIAKASVTLEDESGKRTAAVTADLAVQEEKGANEPCDPQKIASRCGAGMACGGTPATCLEGTAPALQKLAFFGGASPRILALANDADEDADHVAIEFLDAQGNPKTVELVDGEPSTSASGVTLDQPGVVDGAGFGFDVTPATGFESKVPKIAATAYDHMGRASTRVVAAATATPVRSVGQSCDWRGFDACAAGSSCAPGLPSATNACKATATLLTAECTAAPVLDPAKGVTKAFGVAEGTSLWDPPAGCSTDGAVKRPEGVAKLHLAKAASSVTISTAVPETDFDTVVYVLPGCAANSSGALGCNDDVKGFSSSLTLSEVPAGDYTIVIDAVRPGGGRYGVTIDVK